MEKSEERKFKSFILKYNRFLTFFFPPSSILGAFSDSWLPSFVKVIQRKGIQSHKLSILSRSTSGCFWLLESKLADETHLSVSVSMLFQ